MTSLPKLPRNKLGDIDFFHDDFIKLFHHHAGERLSPDLCKRLAWNIEGAVDASRNHVYQTLMQYEGRVLNDRWCNLLSRQVVARLGELKSGVLQLFDRPIREEWVALEVYQVDACEWGDNQPGVLMNLYALTGHPAGHVLQKKFPESWLSFLAYRIGYSRRIQYDQEPHMLTGFRFWGYLKPSQRDPNELEFDDWQIDAKLKKANQSIIKLRHRFDMEPERIPDGKEDEYSCPIDSESYCSECSCSVRECCAAYNRERTYGSRVMGGATPIH